MIDVFQNLFVKVATVNLLGSFLPLSNLTMIRRGLGCGLFIN